MIVYILRERLDWHNQDPWDETRVFTERSKADAAMEKAYKKTRKMCVKDRGDDIVQEDARDYSYFITSKDDYYSAWVEKVKVEG